MRPRGVVDYVFGNDKPLGPGVQAADLADDRPQDLLNLLVDALVGPHFTGSQRSTEPPLGAKHGSQLLHEGVLKLWPAIRAHKRRKSPASQDTAGKCPTHLAVSQGLKRLEEDCVTQAVEVGQGIAIAIPVLRFGTMMAPVYAGSGLTCSPAVRRVSSRKLSIQQSKSASGPNPRPQLI